MASVEYFKPQSNTTYIEQVTEPNIYILYNNKIILSVTGETHDRGRTFNTRTYTEHPSGKPTC